jgi:hydroxypyruvate isomerase
MHRRDFLVASAGMSVAAAQTTSSVRRKGRLKQSAMPVNFAAGTSIEEMCRVASRLGCEGMDLIPPADWRVLKKYALVPTLCPREMMTIEDGILRKDIHDRLEASLHASIDKCAANGCPDIIIVGGQRRGVSYEEGAHICVAFLNRLKKHAEDKGITLCLEIMNSKYENPELGRVDQVCDHVAWGIQVCQPLNSPRVKLLFDIYHAQIMDGNVCESIRENFPWIGHFHTGGVPGRHEIDDTQELNYRFVAKTIADLGFTGCVAHEFRPGPGRDPAQSLASALQIMDV